MTPVLPSLELLDCQYLTMLYLVDSSKAQSLLPAGYSTGTGAQFGSLDADNCGRAVINNKTILKDVHMYIVTTQVAPPHEAESDTLNSAYSYEIATNSPELNAFLATQGFPAILGGTTFSSSGQTVAATYSGSSLYYEFTGAGQVWQDSQLVLDAPAAYRAHSSINGNHYWMDMHWELHYEEVGEGGGLTLHDGVIPKMVVNPGGTTVGHTQLQTGHAYYTFGKIVGGTP